VAASCGSSSKHVISGWRRRLEQHVLEQSTRQARPRLPDQSSRLTQVGAHKALCPRGDAEATEAAEMGGRVGWGVAAQLCAHSVWMGAWVCAHARMVYRCAQALPVRLLIDPCPCVSEPAHLPSGMPWHPSCLPTLLDPARACTHRMHACSQATTC